MFKNMPDILHHLTTDRNTQIHACRHPKVLGKLLRLHQEGSPETLWSLFVTRLLVGCHEAPHVCIPWLCASEWVTGIDSLLFFFFFNIKLILLHGNEDLLTVKLVTMLAYNWSKLLILRGCYTLYFGHIYPLLLPQLLSDPPPAPHWPAILCPAIFICWF